jgi:shikimate dehydrogenase
VFNHLQHIDTAAARIGAVNCVVNNNGRLEGHNTDYRGFLKPLEDRGFSPAEKAVLVLGSGGAARAVIAGCVEAGAAEIAVVNRTEARGVDLVGWCSSTFHFSSITYRGAASSLSSRTLRTFDLIVNTTPVGMYPHEEGSPLPDHLSFSTHQTVYDLIYNPWHTRLFERAQASGALALNGFEMLILQGLYSLALWFPERADEVMGLQDEVLSHTRERVRDFNASP